MFVEVVFTIINSSDTAGLAYSNFAFVRLISLSPKNADELESMIRISCVAYQWTNQREGAHGCAERLGSRSVG